MKIIWEKPCRQTILRKFHKAIETSSLCSQFLSCQWIKVSNENLIYIICDLNRWEPKDYLLKSWKLENFSQEKSQDLNYSTTVFQFDAVIKADFRIASGDFENVLNKKWSFHWLLASTNSSKKMQNVNDQTSNPCHEVNCTISTI